MSQVGGSCILGIRESEKTMTSAEKRIADFILEKPEEVVSLSVEEMAAACSTSVSSLGRFCKKLGYTGFKELSRMVSGDLAVVNATPEYTDISPGDDPMTVFQNTCLSDIKAIENTMRMMEEDAFRSAVRILCAAPRIDFYGIGNSLLVAQDAHNKFMRTGKVSICNADIHVQLLSAVSLKKGDAAVIISYTGQTYDMVNLAQEISKTGCSIITITSYGPNELNKYADVKLYSMSMESYIRSGAMSSRIAQMTVVDALYSSVCSVMYDKVKPYLDGTQKAVARSRPAVK